MKTIVSLTGLLVSIGLLTAEDYGGLSGKAYECVAPDGRFAVQAHQEKGYYKFEVDLVELPAGKAVLSFDPKARFIGAAWNSDSRLVAIEQNQSTHASAVSVYAVAPKGAKELKLPKECDEADATAFESPTRMRTGKAGSLKFHLASEGFQIVKWLSPEELVLSASGMGRWGGDTAQNKDPRFLAEYEVTLHFAADGKSSLRTVVLKKYSEL